MKMITTDKKYIIKTEDSYAEKSFEIVKGNHKFSKEGHREYIYNSKYGKCVILFKNNILTIDRKGIFNSKFVVLFNGEKSSFFYETDFIKQEFLILGESIFYDEDRRIFSFSYRLFDMNNEEFNKISFSIKEI